MTPASPPSPTQPLPPAEDGSPSGSPTASGRAPRRAHFTLTQLTHLERDENGRARQDSYRSASSTRETSPEPLHTPTLSESYVNLRRNLSLSSLRELEARELRKAVWREGEKKPRRDRTERVHRPSNLDEAFAHALRGGLRSATLAGAIRAGINIVILVLRITKKKGIPPRLILHALFGEDVIRFGSMLGLFTFLYKFVIHSLRIFNPGPAGLGAEEWWHSTVAGALSGLSVAVEKPTRRLTIAQQMAVRGAGAGVNSLGSRGWHIPNLDAIVFGLCCGQIMYGFCTSPESLPKGYRRWIQNASRVSASGVEVNISTSREGVFDPAEARKVLEWKGGVTARNRGLLEEYVARGEQGDFGPPYAKCEVLHPWLDSCYATALDRWQSVFRWIFPIYTGLCFLPPIVLRYGKFRKNPRAVLTKSLVSTVKSSSFLATFVAIFQALLCIQHNVYESARTPQWIQRLITHRAYYWAVGFTTCLSLVFEEKKRRAELALYCLPRALEAGWSVLRRRRWVPLVPFGEIALSSAGMAMTMTAFEHAPKELNSLLRSLLFQFLGHS